VVVLYDWKTKTKVAIDEELRQRVWTFQRE
jgi:hypothetical protein